MPERFPQQPKHIDPIDESTLALLGHLIDMWDEAKVSTESVEHRVSQLIENISRHLFSQREDPEPQSVEMTEDLNTLMDFEGTEEEFTAFCEERASYWKSVRDEFLKPE